MEPKTTDYCLLHSVDSIEDFLKSEFGASSSKLKKYFSKSFLNRNFKEKSVLSLPLNFINDGEINPHYEGKPLQVIAEDEEFFVFAKNPGQFVHPLTYDESDNCLSYIRQTRPELLRVNKDRYDRGLLYRLDFETSGLMIYVKNEALYNSLRQNFSDVAKEKIYHCWVDGEMTMAGVFRHSFSSSEEKGKRIRVQSLNVAEGQVGELVVKPLMFDPGIQRTLVEVSLKTGLRHQIRAQLAYMGYPLAGDKFYGGKEAQRLYLHAVTYRLNFQGKEVNWYSEPINFNGI